MPNTAAACLVTQLLPISINPGNMNLGAKFVFVFFAPSVYLSMYLYFCFLEMKGPSYLVLETMFQKGLPARVFGDYNCEIEIATTTEEGILEEPEAIVRHDGLSKV
jgi:hypothetical protein